MNAGHSAAWDQEWEQAAEYYRVAVKEFPTDARALSSLGLALFELQQFETALRVYQHAAKNAPDDPGPPEKMARIYERMGRLSEATRASLQAAELHLKARSAEKAIDNWLRVLSITPENVQVRMQLAAVYERLNRKEEAVAEYISAASLLQSAGQQANALRAIEMAAKVLPGEREVLLALQMIRSGQKLPRPNRPRGGTGPVRMANVREMTDPQAGGGNAEPDPLAASRKTAIEHLAGIVFDEAEETKNPAVHGRGLNALTRGIADITGSSADHTRIMLHIGQAIDSLTQNDEQQAVVELEHAIGQGLRQSSAYYLLGNLMHERAPEKAIKMLQQSVKHPDYALASNLLFGVIYQAAERWNEALPAYLMAFAQADAQTVPAIQREALLARYDALVDSLASLPDKAAQQAASETMKAQLLRPDWRAALRNTRQQLQDPGEKEPTPLAELLLETSGSRVIDAMTRVRQLASRGHTRTALEEALYALQDAPAYLPLHLLVGDLLLQNQQTSEAVQKYLVVADLYGIRGETNRSARIFRQVAQLLPTDISVRQKLIDLLVLQESTDEALEEFLRLGELFYQLADLDKARQTYLDGLQIARRSKNNRAWGVKLLLRVADIDLQRLNLRQALRIYEQIRVVQPDDIETRAQIITLNYRLGDPIAAQKDLDEVIQYLMAKDRQAEAIQLIQNLLQEYGDQLLLHRRLAELYARNRQVPEAIAHLDAAADAMMTNHCPAEAAKLIEVIIALKPANTADYQAALEEIRRAV